MFKRFFKPLYLCVFTAVIFFIVLILFPEKAKEGVTYGIMLSGSVIIPSFFPFTVCVLFILRTGILDKIHLKSEIAVMIMSFIGGYPLGAKTVNEMYKLKKINQKKAGLMLCYCVNAGPSFIISAIGVGMLQSKTLGYILLFAHIASSLINALIIKIFFDKKETVVIKKNDNPTNLADTFVNSVADGASSVFAICTFVILFSTINAYLLYLANKFELLKFLIYLTEVTTASAYTKNVYLIAFLLGFSGLCIWCQVFSYFAGTKVKMLPFIISRFTGGLLSSGIVFIITKFANITMPTLSNALSYQKKLSFSGIEVSVSLVCMIIIFLISLSKKRLQIDLK